MDNFLTTTNTTNAIITINGYDTLTTGVSPSTTIASDWINWYDYGYDWPSEHSTADNKYRLVINDRTSPSIYESAPWENEFPKGSPARTYEENRKRIKNKIDKKNIKNKKSAETEKYSARRYIPEIDKVIYSPPATIVFWTDGTKTVAKCMEGDTFNMWTGLSMCIARKALGDKYHNTFRKYCEKKKNVYEPQLDAKVNASDVKNFKKSKTIRDKKKGKIVASRSSRHPKKGE